MNPFFLLQAADALMKSILVLFSWGLTIRVVAAVFHG
jgi:hypothetical protein